MVNFRFIHKLKNVKKFYNILSWYIIFFRQVVCVVFLTTPDGIVGYHASLTHQRSPVQTRVWTRKTLITLICVTFVTLCNSCMQPQRLHGAKCHHLSNLQTHVSCVVDKFQSSSHFLPKQCNLSRSKTNVFIKTSWG